MRLRVSQQATSKQPLAQQWGQKLNLPRVFRPRAAVVGQFDPGTAPKQPQDGLKWPHTAPNVARGFRLGRRRGPAAVSWDVIHLGNVWGPFWSYFTCPPPRTRRHLAQNGPTTAPNGARWLQDMLHRGLVAVSWDGTHLGGLQAALWSYFACFPLVSGLLWPRNSHKTAPHRPQMALRWILHQCINVYKWLSLWLINSWEQIRPRGGGGSTTTLARAIRAAAG